MPRLDPSVVGRFEFDGSDSSHLYLGGAAVDALTSDPIWRISKVTVSGSSVSIKYANSGNYTAVWDNRASYTYV